MANVGKIIDPKSDLKLVDYDLDGDMLTAVFLPGEISDPEDGDFIKSKPIRLGLQEIMSISGYEYPITDSRWIDLDDEAYDVSKAIDEAIEEAKLNID